MRCYVAEDRSNTDRIWSAITSMSRLDDVSTIILGSRSIGSRVARLAMLARTASAACFHPVVLDDVADVDCARAVGYTSLTMGIAYSVIHSVFGPQPALTSRDHSLRNTLRQRAL